MQPLNRMRAAVIDMDGVLWQGERPLPGLTEFFAALRERGVRFVLATNNASRTPEQFVQKLAGMGVSVRREEVLTSAMGAALYLAQLWARENTDGRPPARIFAIGGPGVCQALLEQNFHLCSLDDLDADFVVCGMDPGLSWDKLATATLNLRAGARFVGTNPDLSLPTERGLTHGNGAILAALQAATGVAPVIIGKPEPTLYQQALDLLGTEPSETLAIGDRLDTDILGAARAGLPSVLVLSGVSTRADLAGLPYGPTWIRQDIRDLTREFNEYQPAAGHVSTARHG
jgi:4-nitrophenyl phosphatase